MVMILSSHKGSLALESDDGDWCQVVLEFGGQKLPLGADLRSIIAERLLHSLLGASAGPTSGMLDGVAVRWVLSLAERHSTLYAGDEAGRRTLFIQADDGSLIAKLPLDPFEMARWREQLGQLDP